MPNRKFLNAAKSFSVPLLVFAKNASEILECGASKINPNCQLHFLFGNTEDIYDKLNKNRINFGFIENTASAKANGYSCIIIPTKQNSIFCEKAGCTLEPLNPSDIQTAVIWKKASNNLLVNSFSDLIFSNQAAINAEYVK